MTADARYTRPKPEHWDRMLDVAQRILPVDELIPPFDTQAAGYMLSDLDSCNPEEYDAHAYYGLGLGMRHLHLALNEEAAREQATTTLADTFRRYNLDAAKLFEQDSNPSRDLFILASGAAALSPFAQQAFNKLPPAEHLLTDSLVVATREQRGGRSLYDTAGGVRSMLVQRVRQGDAAANLTSSNAVSGAVVILNRATRAKKAANPHASASDILSQNLLKRSAQGAMLHTEEFANNRFLDEIFPPTETGDLGYDPSKLPKVPDLPATANKQTEILHKNRLMCPAVHVGGLALIGNVLDIVWTAAQRV